MRNKYSPQGSGQDKSDIGRLMSVEMEGKKVEYSYSPDGKRLNRKVSVVGMEISVNIRKAESPASFE